MLSLHQCYLFTCAPRVFGDLNLAGGRSRPVKSEPGANTHAGRRVYQTFRGLTRGECRFALTFASKLLGKEETRSRVRGRNEPSFDFREGRARQHGLESGSSRMEIERLGGLPHDVRVTERRGKASPRCLVVRTDQKLTCAWTRSMMPWNSSRLADELAKASKPLLATSYS